MTDLAELGIRIRADGVVEVDRQLDRLTDSAGKAEGATRRLSGAVGGELDTGARRAAAGLGPLGGIMASLGTGGLIAAAGLGAVALAAIKGVQDFAEVERLGLRVDAVLRATGGAAGLTGQQIREMANDIEASTFHTEEDALRASAVLASFGSVAGNAFRETMDRAADLASVMGTDLAGAAQLLGRVFEAPEQGMLALRRAGIVLNDEQKETIKQMIATGDRAGATRVLLDELGRSIGGAAQAEAQGVAGQFNKLRASVGNLFEAFGELLVRGGAINSTLRELSAIAGAINAIGAKDPLQPALDQERSISEMMRRQEAIAARQPGPNARGSMVENQRRFGDAAMAAIDQERAKAADDLLRTYIALGEEQDEQASETSGQLDREMQIAEHRAKITADVDKQVDRYKELARQAGIEDDLTRKIAQARKEASDRTAKDIPGAQAEDLQRVADAAEKIVRAEHAREQAVKARKEAETEAKETTELMRQADEDFARNWVKLIDEMMAADEKRLLQAVKSEDSLKKYIEDLQKAQMLEGLSVEARAVMVAIMEAESKLLDELGNKRRELSQEELEQIVSAARETQRLKEINEDLKEAERDRARIARDLSTVIMSSTEDAILATESLSDVYKALEQDIARVILRAAVLGPIQRGIQAGVEGGLSGLGSLFGGGTSTPAQPYTYLFHQGGEDSPFWRGIPNRGPMPVAHQGLMDDEFMAVLQKGERVVPKGSGPESPIINIKVDARYAQPGVAREINAQLAARMPQIIEAALSESAARASLGGSYARQMGRR